MTCRCIAVSVVVLCTHLPIERMHAKLPEVLTEITYILQY